MARKRDPIRSVHSRRRAPVVPARRCSPPPRSSRLPRLVYPARRGSLVSADSLATFAGGSLGITIVWGGIERIVSLPHYLWLGALISGLFGLCVLWSDFADPNRAARPAVPMRILAAVVNTFILFNAASGGLATVGVAGSGSKAQVAPATTQSQ